MSALKRQTGIRVTLELFLPYSDLDGLSSAIAASKKLQTADGLAKLAEIEGVEIESASAKQTTRAVG